MNARALLLILLPSVALADGGAVSITGFTLGPEVGTGIYGYEATGNLGARTLGISYVDRFVVAWDGQAALSLGQIAYEDTYYWLYGARGRASGEAGARLTRDLGWSMYAGVRGELDGSLIAEAGAPLNGGKNINNGGSLIGPLATGHFALGGGASGVWVEHYLLVVAELILDADSPQSYAPGRAFIGGGLRARYDVASRLFLTGQAWFGSSATQKDAALQSSAQTSRWGLSGELVFRKGAHLMGTVGISVQRDQTVTVYTGGITQTANGSIDSRIYLSGGYAL